MSSPITERQRINTSSAVKVPCKAATTANITLSGEQTIDGVSCVTNDRVLVKDQTDATENGIYICNTSSWSRARDWDGSFDVKKGTFVYVTGGTSSGFWYVTTTDPIVPGTTSVTIAQASSQLVTFSAFAQLLLDDADAAAMFTTLGISAFIQTLLNDADAATARTTLGAAADAEVVHDTGNETIAGNKTFSGDTTLGTAVVSSAGVHTAGTVPLDRVIRTFATGTGSLDVGTVSVDDYVMVNISAVWTLSSAANGFIRVDVWSTAGTATIEFAGQTANHPELFTVCTSSVTTYYGNCNFIFKVTGAGTLTIGASTVTASGVTISGSIYSHNVMVLRNS